MAIDGSTTTSALRVLADVATAVGCLYEVRDHVEVRADGDSIRGRSTILLIRMWSAADVTDGLPDEFEA